MEFQPKNNSSFSGKVSREVKKNKQEYMAALILCSLTYVEVDQQTAEDMEKERYHAIHVTTPMDLRRWLPPVPCVTHRIGECSRAITKQLEGSDVKDSQARLALKKEYVINEFQPMLNSNENMRDGIDVIVYDSKGNKYENMRFILWGTKMYVFTRQWKQFSEDYKLISKNDSVKVWMFRDKYTRKLCSVITPILDPADLKMTVIRQRIWNYYNENKAGLSSDRTPNSLCNRWCTINEKVAKFIGSYNQVLSKNQSGLTEQNKIDQALEHYESVMTEKFMFMRHWNALRFAPKFQSCFKKKNKSAKDKDASSQSVDSQIHSLESDEMMERPIGRKAAKKLKRTGNEATDEDSLELLRTMQKDALAIASSRSESVNRSLQLQQEMMQLQKEEQERQKEIMQLQKEKLQLRLAKEERERQKEERERQVYEASIMAVDTSKMLPDQVKYYDALKARIMRNIL
ncbi:hypothetical protein AgCh_006288 [Apium graveolens]